MVDLEKVYFSEMPLGKIPTYLEEKELPGYKLIDDQGKVCEFQLESTKVEFGYDLPDDKFRQPFYAKKSDSIILCGRYSCLRI